MKCKNQSNKKYKIKLTLGTICGAAGIIGITGIAVTSSISTSALSYSTSSDVSFTFAPTLSIGLSTDSLSIDNLVPGNISDSNSVKVTVSSNTPYGYVLSAGVGSTVSTDPCYNTSDLVHDNSTTQVPTTNKFSSIATSASLQTLDTDNTWGYSTSTDGGTSWSTYSGLSHTETKPLLDISDSATPSTIDFKIAARSASTQASGIYNNVITFYAVGKPQTFHMQEPEAIKARLQNIGDELQAIDQRDGKEYWVAKLADGNIWMTQNLDLCIGCDDTAALNSQNTDLNISGSSAYEDDYAFADGTITWSPASTAITSSVPIVDDRVPNWGSSAYVPYSAEGGDLYVYTSNSNDDDIIYNSLDDCISDNHPVNNCTHYHVGNYYNWSAAIASNRSVNISRRGSVAGNSICPFGWRLPKGRANKIDTATTREFGQLFYTTGITSDLTSSSYAELDSFNKIRTSPIFFVRSGFVTDGFGLTDIAHTGLYWSSTLYTTTYANGISFNADYISSNSDYNVRRDGFSVRCVMR